MLRKALYPKIESRLNQAAGYLNQKGFSPNQLTLAGLALNFLAAWVYASGIFFLGGLVLLAAACGDLLDGPLARTSGRVTKFGAFLDSTLDRYSDFFLFGGLALHYAKQGQTSSFLLVMGIIAGAFATSYAKARAENFIPECGIGIFERAERIAGLALGSFIPALMPFLLWVLFFGTNGTAIHRILYTKQVLENSASS